MRVQDLLNTYCPYKTVSFDFIDDWIVSKSITHPEVFISWISGYNQDMCLYRYFIEVVTKLHAEDYI